MQRRGLSKSRIISHLQCRKRLWLETHRPELVKYKPGQETRFQTGHEVNEIARRLEGAGTLIDYPDDLSGALEATHALLDRGDDRTLFEATFEHEGVLVRADILSIHHGIARLCEVKSSTSVKDHHFPDAAVQAWVLQQCGIEIEAIQIQHIDSGFVYPGGNDYTGLLKTSSVDSEVRPLLEQVPIWIEGARRTLEGREPEIETGKHCYEPFDCPLINHCSQGQARPDLPLTLLPNAARTIPRLEARGYRSLRDIPSGELKSVQQERVRLAHLINEPYLDPAASKVMRAFAYPRSFVDFETIAFAVPRWKGTRPYQQIPFQWSAHVESRNGSTRHIEFLDLSGEFSALAFVDTLLAALPDDGPIFSYNAAFESKRLDELGVFVPGRMRALQRLRDRIVDLLPITRKYYYHPGMNGSWSIKSVLPTIPGSRGYEELGTVQSGEDAQVAYLEAIAPMTHKERREQIDLALRRYCAKDTEALLTLARFLQGHKGQGRVGGI